MKRFYAAMILSVAASIMGFTQIPYFAATVGNNNVYGYTSVKFRPGNNLQETYSTFQYGVGNMFATGIDLYTNNGGSYGGVLLRFGLPVSEWFNIGAQVTPTFDMTSNLSLSYVNTSLYLNGNITEGGQYFWCGNTWYGINKGIENTISQYLYLGASYDLPRGQKITPMVGTIYSWKFDQDADLAIGAYWIISKSNIYLWGNDLFKRNPRVVVGIDFTFSAVK